MSSITSADSAVWFVTGLCGPESDEDPDKYLNDEEGDDEGDSDDDNKGDTDSALPPVMKSEQQNLEVPPGNTVVLPCETVNYGKILS
jgi:hypothetical protein